MPNFFGQLQAFGQTCFTDKLIKANHIIVAEFYVNTLETNFWEVVVTTVYGVQVGFSPMTINAMCGLLDTDNRVFIKHFRELGSQWLVHKLRNRVPLEWFTSHRRVD